MAVPWGRGSSLTNPGGRKNHFRIPRYMEGRPGCRNSRWSPGKVEQHPSLRHPGQYSGETPKVVAPVILRTGLPVYPWGAVSPKSRAPEVQNPTTSEIAWGSVFLCHCCMSVCMSPILSSLSVCFSRFLCFCVCVPGCFCVGENVPVHYKAISCKTAGLW